MNIISTLISMSLSASIMLLLFLSARRMMQRYLPSSGLYAMLLLIMLRLLIPYSFEFSLMNSMPLPTEIPSSNMPAAEQSENIETDAQPVPQVSSNYTDNTTSSENSDNADDVKSTVSETLSDTTSKNFSAQSSAEKALFPWETFLPILWSIGACGSFGLNIAAYLKYRKRIIFTADYSEFYTDILSEIAGRHRYPNVFISEQADTPMVIGLIRPIIVIPNNDYSQNEIRNILRHEYCHYRRFDLPIKWIAVFTCSLHWFNPLMIVFQRKLDEYCELCCDEAVVRSMNPAERKSYIQTLLKTAEHQVNSRGILLTTLSGDAKKLNERFSAIIKAAKLTRRQIIASTISLAACFVISMLLGTYSPQKESAPTEDLSDDAISASDSANSSRTFNYASITFDMTDTDAVWHEKEKYWTSSIDDGHYINKPIFSGNTDNRTVIRSLFNLIYWEKYKYIDKIQYKDLYTTDAICINFDDEITFYLEKEGYLYIYLSSDYIFNFTSSNEYPEFLFPDEKDLENPDIAPDGICVFKVPDDLYEKARSMISVFMDEEEEYFQEAPNDFEGFVAQNGKQYPFSDIECDYVYAIMCSKKIRIVSDSYNCDFFAAVGSDEFDLVWDSFNGIGLCNQIQPVSQDKPADTHVMIIGPEDYGEDYTDEYITIYADSGIIKISFKSDEMWYSSDKNWSKICRKIASYK